jgi:hypothetical protein
VNNLMDDLNNYKVPRVATCNALTVQKELRPIDLELLTLLDVTLKKGNSINGWMKITTDVPEHTDGCGICFLFMAKGIGKLTTINKQVILDDECCITFDDRKSHSFEVLSKSCTFFICNVQKRIKTNYINFLGNY